MEGQLKECKHEIVAGEEKNYCKLCGATEYEVWLEKKLTKSRDEERAKALAVLAYVEKCIDERLGKWPLVTDAIKKYREG